MPAEGRHRALLALLAALGLCRLYRPTDGPFLGDQAQLLLHAIGLNQTGELATYGLPGARGIDYGPAPIWFYQACLHVTSDLAAIALARDALVTLATAAALAGLARAWPRLDPRFGAVALLSPYLWVYSRDSWDNSFLIPLMGGAFAGYVAFCRAPRLRTLALVLACLTLALLTHLMCVPVVAAIVLHALVAHRGWLAARRVPVLLLVANALAVMAPYLYHAASQLPSATLPLAFQPSSVAFALGPARPFTALGCEYFFGDAWYALPGATAGLIAVLALTGLAHLFFWGGAAMALREVRATPAAAVALLALALTAGSLVLNHLSVHPHYYSAVWPAAFLCVWAGLTAAWERGPTGRALIAAYVLALAIALAASIACVRARGGARTLHFGPSLTSWLAIARELRGYDPRSPVALPLDDPYFPLVLSALRRLDGGTGPVRELRVEYRSARPSDARLALREVR